MENWTFCVQVCKHDVIVLEMRVYISLKWKIGHFVCDGKPTLNENQGGNGGHSHLHYHYHLHLQMIPGANCVNISHFACQGVDTKKYENNFAIILCQWVDKHILLLFLARVKLA